MKLFRSNRERKLWVVTILVLMAIYSTLGLAGKMAVYLAGSDFLGITFFIGFTAVVIAIIASGLFKKPGWKELWVWLGIFAVYATVIVRMGIDPVERTHLFEYGLLAILIHEALIERKLQNSMSLKTAFLAIGITILFGLVDELLQGIIPNRVFDIRDIGFNAFAAVSAVGIKVSLSWLRRRFFSQ